MPDPLRLVRRAAHQSIQVFLHVAGSIDHGKSRVADRSGEGLSLQASRRCTDLASAAVADGLDSFKLPVLNVWNVAATVVNAVPREAWFTVDLRSLDSATQDKLQTAVVSTAKRIGEQEHVGFRMEQKMGIDYSKGFAAAGAAESSGGTDSAGRQQLFSEAGDAGDCGSRRRLY